MADDKVEMNTDTESFTNTNDPKDVQELTQYVSCFLNITSMFYRNLLFLGPRIAPNHPG